MPAKLLFLFLGWLDSAGLFLVFINRILSYLRNPLYKRLIMLSSFGGVTLFFSLVSWFGGRIGRGLVLLVLAGLGAHEGLFRWKVRRLRGSAPVARVGPSVSITRPITTTDLIVYRYAVRLPRCSQHPPVDIGAPLPQSLLQKKPRLRIAHISDLHLNDHLPESYYERIVQIVAGAEPDLLFITGDLVSDVHAIQKLPAMANRMPARLGRYAIFGNHDHWAGADEVARGMNAASVDLLGNGHRRIQDGELKLLIQGCEEPWSPDKMEAPRPEDGEVLLALSHSADQVYRLNKLGAAAVFSGHYHAGQLQIPLFGPLFIPSKFGRRFYHGHYIVGDTHLFVTAGLGAAHPPLRIYCPPDLFIVDLY